MILGKGEKVTQKDTVHFWFANVIACLSFLAVFFFFAKIREWKPPTKNSDILYFPLKIGKIRSSSNPKKI